MSVFVFEHLTFTSSDNPRLRVAAIAVVGEVDVIPLMPMDIMDEVAPETVEETKDVCFC